MTGLPTSPLDVAVTLEVLVPGAIGEVFDFIAAEDVLPKILPGYGLVPAVNSTADVSGPWDSPGSNRIVHLSDGSRVREGVTHYDRPGYFAYRVRDPSFAPRHLMTGATGQVWLAASADGMRVRRTCTFRARNRLLKLPLTLFVATQWRGYMDVCLKNVVADFAR
jgi:hypothetical protein